MKRAAIGIALVAIAIVAAAIALLVLGNSECERAGGELVVDHYMPTTTFVTSGKSVRSVTSMTPIYACEVPR